MTPVTPPQCAWAPHGPLTQGRCAVTTGPPPAMRSGHWEAGEEPGPSQGCRRLLTPRARAAAPDPAGGTDAQMLWRVPPHHPPATRGDAGSSPGRSGQTAPAGDSKSESRTGLWDGGPRRGQGHSYMPAQARGPAGARPARLGASRRPQASGAHASDLGPAPAPPAQPTPTPGPRAAQPSRRTGLTHKLAGSSNSARARCPGGPWKLPPAWVQPEQASRTLLQVGPRSSASAHLR